MSCAENYIITIAITNVQYKISRCIPCRCREYIEEKLSLITTLTTKID